MSSFSLEFDCDNAAFMGNGEFDYVEVARILRHVARRVELHGAGEYHLKDYNGNKVGSAHLEVDDPEEDEE